MPTGASLLLACCVLLAAGFGRRVAAVLGMHRMACGAWALCAAAASALNLGWPPGRELVLVNPGGCLVPLALALYLISSRAAGMQLRSLRRTGLAAAAAAAILAAGTAYGEQAGIPGAAAALAGCGVAVATLALGGDARGAMAGAAAGLGLSALVLGLLAWADWAPWPAALGGGPTFDAGVLGAVGTQALDCAMAAWRAQQPGAAALRASQH